MHTIKISVLMDVMLGCNEDDIYTGDILLYQSNTPSSSIQRLFTDSMWNHIGIAVRLSDPNDYNSVVSGSEGFLCSLDFIDTNTLDVITRSITTGMALIPLGIMRSRYSRIAVRHLKVEYRDYYIINKILNHIDKFKSDKFVTSTLTILGPILGTSIKTEQNSTFCSENVGYFLKNMGENISIELGLLAPGHFIPSTLPLERYMSYLSIYHKKETALSTTISCILIITIFFLIIVTLLLPRKLPDHMKYIV